MESKLAVISPSKTQEPSASHGLIREWLFRFGVNFEKDVAPVLPLWQEAFGEMKPETLETLFRRALRNCKFFPRVADILEPPDNQAQSLTAADLKWQQVLDYCRRWVNPDMPGGLTHGAPRISERTMTAIRAAGGLTYINECSLENLQWAKKRFVESYIAWETLKRDEYLLPDGPVKELLAGTAEQKQLPSSSTYDAARVRRLAYEQELKDSGCEQPDIKRAIRAVAGELAPRPPMRSLDEQKQILRDRGLLK